MDKRQIEGKNWRHSIKKEDGNIETSLPAPFPFDYIEKHLRKKNFGILTTLTPEGRPHSVGSSLCDSAARLALLPIFDNKTCAKEGKKHT